MSTSYWDGTTEILLARGISHFDVCSSLPGKRIMVRQRRTKIFSLLLSIGAALGAPAAWCAYTANCLSTVRWVKIYNSDTIFFALEQPPTTQCPEQSFVLSPALTEQQRSRYYAMLIAAKVGGNQVAVGYDDQSADCYRDRPIAHALNLL